MHKLIPYLLLMAAPIPSQFADANQAGNRLAANIAAAERESRQGTAIVQRNPGTAIADDLWRQPGPDVEEQMQRLRDRSNTVGPHERGPALLDPTVPDPSTIVQHGSATPAPLPSRGGPVTFVKNTALTGVAPNTDLYSTTNEPSVGAAGNRVFFSFNWWAADSTNGGDSFSGVDPFNGPFAPVNGGFCCDQVVLYEPANNVMFFVQQYISDAGGGTQRINVDQNNNGTYDCSYDITSQTFGLAAGVWPDFPDLAATGQHLFHASNNFTSGGSWAGVFVARYPLSELASCAGSLSIAYHTETSWGSLRFAQGATNTMYYADHNSLSSLRIWSWPDASASPTTVDRSVAPWSNGTRVCPGPDGRDWCGFLDQRILGGYLAGNHLAFLWTPSQDGSFPFPYIRIARFNTSGGLAHIDDSDVFSNDFAWAYASGAGHTGGDAAGTVLWGGGATYYHNCAAWIADSTNGYVLAPMETYAVINGTTGPSSNRTGDYLSARIYPSPVPEWSATCFAYENMNYSTTHYVRFRRSGLSDLIFANSWE